MGRMFGTDGVRGIANTELSVELAMKIGRAAAHILSCSKKGEKAKILIGKDTRISSSMLESALTAGICSYGADVYLLGEIPTPAVALLCKKYSADAGIMISASHNPAEFNGIKIFNKDGYKLSDAMEDKIEELVKATEELYTGVIGENLGRVVVVEKAADDYADYIVDAVSAKNLNLKVALDCSNGAASKTAEKIFRKLGADITLLSAIPDGININKDCGSTNLEPLKKFVKENGFQLGLAFDGDADRCLAVDENGEEVDGDRIIALFAWYLKQNGRLNEDTAVVTVMSNLGFFEFADKHGINAISAKVGDRYVLEKMLEGGYNLGGEQSGHIILSDYQTTGDGEMTGAFLLKMLYDSKQKLSCLAKIMEKYPQVIKNVKVKNEDKAKLDTDKEIAAVIASASEELKKCGRVLVRASGTEPLIRIMLEGKNLKDIERLADKIAAVIEERIKK